MANNHLIRLQAQIKRNLSEIISFKVKDPRLGFVSIPEVKVSGDLSIAWVYVSFIIKSDEEKGLEVLEHSKGFIRTELAKMMATRRVPELKFILDHSFEEGQKIDALIEKGLSKDKNED